MKQKKQKKKQIKKIKKKENKVMKVKNKINFQILIISLMKPTIKKMILIKKMKKIIIKMI